MRWLASTILALGMMAGAGAAPVLAAAAPGPAAKAAIPETTQVEKVHRRWHHHGGFGGFGIYVGPRWGGYYGGPYYGWDDGYYGDDYYYAPRRYYYPRYRHRHWGGHRHRYHRHHHRHRHHHHRRHRH